jgi:hypothetical protein
MVCSERALRPPELHGQQEKGALGRAPLQAEIHHPWSTDLPALLSPRSVNFLKNLPVSQDESSSSLPWICGLGSRIFLTCTVAVWRSAGLVCFPLIFILRNRLTLKYSTLTDFIFLLLWSSETTTVHTVLYFSGFSLFSNTGEPMDLWASELEQRGHHMATWTPSLTHRQAMGLFVFQVWIWFVLHSAGCH